MSEEGKAVAEARRAARIAEIEAAQRTPERVGGKDRSTRRAERAAAKATGTALPAHPKIAKFVAREEAKKGGGQGGGKGKKDV